MGGGGGPGVGNEGEEREGREAGEFHAGEEVGDCAVGGEEEGAEEAVVVEEDGGHQLVVEEREGSLLQGLWRHQQDVVGVLRERQQWLVLLFALGITHNLGNLVAG